MPKYNYKCDFCGHNYAEVRAESDPMFHPNCNACPTGKYVEEAND